jgi:hypothetical protein
VGAEGVGRDHRPRLSNVVLNQTTPGNIRTIRRRVNETCGERQLGNGHCLDKAMPLMPKGTRDVNYSARVQADRGQLFVPAQLNSITSRWMRQRLGRRGQAEGVDKLARLRKGDEHKIQVVFHK